MIITDCMFARARLERVCDLLNVEEQMQFLEHLEAVINRDAVKRMLMYLLTHEYCVELKCVLTDYLNIPTNLTNKETVVFLQLLGD